MHCMKMNRMLLLCWPINLSPFRKYFELVLETFPSNPKDVRKMFHLVPVVMTNGEIILLIVFPMGNLRFKFCAVQMMKNKKITCVLRHLTTYIIIIFGTVLRNFSFYNCLTLFYLITIFLKIRTWKKNQMNANCQNSVENTRIYSFSSYLKSKYAIEIEWKMMKNAWKSVHTYNDRTSLRCFVFTASQRRHTAVFFNKLNIRIRIH